MASRGFRNKMIFFIVLFILAILFFLGLQQDYKKGAMD